MGLRAARLIKHFVGRVKQQVSLCVRGYSRQAGRHRVAAALGFQLFETDMGELLFSGLTPNLPLMDGPPNSPLLLAHSGAARKQRRSPVAPPPPPFGREMDQPTVCQGPLSGSPPQSAAPHSQNNGAGMMDSNGIHAVLYKPRSFTSVSKCSRRPTERGRIPLSLCTYRKAHCRKKIRQHHHSKAGS